MAKRTVWLPRWIVSVVLAAPVLVSVALPLEPVEVSGVAPFWCSIAPRRPTWSQEAVQGVAPLFQRRHFDFAPSRPPFPRVI